MAPLLRGEEVGGWGVFGDGVEEEGEGRVLDVRGCGVLGWGVGCVGVGEMEGGGRKGC